MLYETSRDHSGAGSVLLLRYMGPNEVFFEM